MSLLVILALRILVSCFTITSDTICFVKCFYLWTQVGWKRVDKGYMTTIGTMTWVKDRSITVDHIEKSEEVSDWNLMIKNVQPLHAGMYECQITTPEKLRRKVQLNVFGETLVLLTCCQHKTVNAHTFGKSNYLQFSFNLKIHVFL